MRIAVPALELGQPLQRADGGVIAFKHAVYHLPVGAQRLNEQGENNVLYPLHADGQRLRDEDIGKPVHRQAGEAVGLAEDKAAAGHIRPHDGLSVIPGVFYAPRPEGRVERVVRVARNKADANLAVPAEKARAEVLSLLADGIDERAVFRVLRAGNDLRLIYPRVALLDPAGAFRSDGHARILALYFHWHHPHLFSAILTYFLRRGNSHFTLT